MTKACLLTLLLALVGCDQLDNCPDAQDAITVEPRPATDTWAGSTDLESLTYESAPWDGGFTPFPPNTNVHFVHGLGVEPFLIKTYLSFGDEGTNGAGGGDATENAGNQARVQCVDDREIVIENDTCEEDFFIRVVAIGSPKGRTEMPRCTPE